MRLSILWRIMEIEEGVIRRDLHSSSYDTKAEFNNIVLTFIQTNSYYKNIIIFDIARLGLFAPQIFSK